VDEGGVSGAATIDGADVAVVETAHGPVRLWRPNATTASRARTLLTKEPETIEWIERFDDGDVFWDIGANVGVYTLYAAVAGRAPLVLAFEPGAFNHAALNRNIELNGLGSRVRAHCVAVSERTMLDVLHMKSTDWGRSQSSFGEAVDYLGERFEASFMQGAVGISMDDLVRVLGAAFPNRIKIDVDGIEDRIVRGGRCVLADERVKSVSIELDEGRRAYTAGVLAELERAGLVLESRRHAPEFDSGSSATIFNYQLFRR
jgi:FkbM family methyltransferase